MTINLTTNLETIALNEQANYRLNEINKIKDYFECEIREQAVLIKNLSKYITGFGYKDKMLIVSLTVFSGLNIFTLKQKRTQD